MRLIIDHTKKIALIVQKINRKGQSVLFEANSAPA
jgi:hypothetical protein